MSRNWAAGGGQSLVGTPETIVDKMAKFSRAGLDGILLTALEPEKQLGQVQARVIPLMVEAGLRRPHTGQAVL